MPAQQNRLINTGKLVAAPFYKLSVQTGVITAVAAGTSSAGHVIAVRNSGDPEFHVTRMLLHWQSTVDPSAAQRVGFRADLLSAYTAAHTGGTGASTASPISRAEGAAVARYPALSAVVARVAGTDALVAGTQTIGGKVGCIDAWALAAAATVKQTTMEREWVSPDKHPLFILGADEGLLIRNTVLMANSLAGILTLELDGWVRDND